MPERWAILAVLFAVRATMGFQFQSVAALTPLLNRELGVDLADIGILIGLYLAPGAGLALPGGVIGQRFGDKRTVLAGLGLMIAGSILMALSSQWSVQVAGRLIAGTGGVLLNVLMSKMVTDWFAGREIATAMAIFVNSWPIGIAISLLVLPAVGAAYGVSAAYLAVSGLIAGGTLLFAVSYRAPACATGSRPAPSTLVPSTMLAVMTAGLIWAFYNVGLAMVFSFGPAFLADRGWTVTAAGSTVSIVMWLAALSIPFGGFLADHTQRPNLLLIVGCAAFAMLLLLVAHGGPVLPIFVALGLVCGLPVGPIMSLPARVLEPGTRAVGMGLFFTVYYLGMMAGPALAGSYAKWSGSLAAPFVFGAGLLITCPMLLWAYHSVRMRVLTT